MAQYSITLARAGGEGTPDTLRYSTNTGKFYYKDANDNTVYLTNDDQQTIVPLVPTRVGYDFRGFWTQQASGGTQYISSAGALKRASSGNIFADVASLNGTTLYARWQANYWGECTDYFGAEAASSGVLMLVRSESGASRANVAPTGVVSTTSGNITTVRPGALAIQSGNSAVGAFFQGPELLNPVCTYRVKAAGTVTFTLGKAWSSLGNYMLVAGEYRTKADGEPTLTLRGVANEGADAINTWQVTFNVDPDHVAQDRVFQDRYGTRYSAVSGGGELIECNTVASCNPVVPRINGTPCASDVVRGKLTVNAVTAAYGGESAPTADSGFVLAGVPKEGSDVDFFTYSFTAERSL